MAWLVAVCLARPPAAPARAQLKSYGPIQYESLPACAAALTSSPCYINQRNSSYGDDVGPGKAAGLKPLDPLCVPLDFDDDATPESGPGSNVCEVNITLSEDWDGPVYLFYVLTNFYQNHRLYVSDRADNQLTGQNSATYYSSQFTDLYTDLPADGCSSAVLPGGVFCTATADQSPWIPVR
eukprot:SAG22_NODE_1397_length_4507_cov_56.156534_5_plen_181_part_00